VPAGEGKLQPNPYKKWSDIDPSLPAVAIEVLGPPPTSGTRDAFAELAMEGGCKTFGWIKDMKKTDKNRYKAVCHSIREDGGYVEAGENDHASHLVPASDWPEYVSSLGLEIIRTKDFYGLILKGSNISHLFIGGGEEFLAELDGVTRPAMGVAPEELSLRKWSRDLPSPLEAICIGTGSR